MPSYSELARSRIVRRTGVAIAVGTAALAISGEAFSQSTPENQEQKATLAQPIGYIASASSLETNGKVHQVSRKQHHGRHGHRHALVYAEPLAVRPHGSCEPTALPDKMAVFARMHPMSHTLHGDTNTEIIFNYYLDEGLSPIAAAGFAGNAQEESHSNPAETNGGIDQDTGGRWGKIESLAEEERRSSADLGIQLQYSCLELTDEKGAAEDDHATLELVQGSTTPTSAAEIVMTYYERPNPYYANFSARADAANYIYDWYVQSHKG
jgi:tail lysozyme